MLSVRIPQTGDLQNDTMKGRDTPKPNFLEPYARSSENFPFHPLR